MKIKITIGQDTRAAEVFRALMAEKEAFRNAVKTGKANEYARSNSREFAQPVSLNS